MALTAEIVIFRTLPGPTKDDVQKAAASVGPWLAGQRGFVVRSLSCSDEGLWTDHVLWASHEDATRAGAAFMAEPSAAAFMAMIDPESVQMSHAPVVVRQTV